MVKTIQKMKTTTSPMGAPQTTMGEWNNSWARMPNIVTIPTKTSKPQEVPFVPYNGGYLFKNIFQDINKQMLEISYTLNFGKLLKVAPNIKNYLWYKLFTNKPTRML
jgi:hypothetical protein